MHLICLLEHSMGDYQKIAEWLHSLPLKNKLGESVRACPRELRLIDIVVDESCVDQLLSYLPKGIGHVDVRKVNLMKKILQKITPLQPVDESSMGTNTLNNGFPQQVFSYFIILGAMPDRKDPKTGLDLL